jgi:hypothetical protein
VSAHTQQQQQRSSGSSSSSTTTTTTAHAPPAEGSACRSQRVAVYSALPRLRPALRQSHLRRPAKEGDPKARTGICGTSPLPGPLSRTSTTLSPEHSLYPRRFLDRVGLRRYVLCEELRYNGQRRRDVPDLASGSLYIDVGDRAARRKRHSFHHELWHMVDFHLL